jgi:hypothetical protein
MNPFDFGPSTNFIQELLSTKREIRDRIDERTKAIKSLDLLCERHLQAIGLLNRASDELYNNGMSPKLLADIIEFLYPTKCEENKHE